MSILYVLKINTTTFNSTIGCVCVWVRVLYEYIHILILLKVAVNTEKGTLFIHII